MTFVRAMASTLYRWTFVHPETGVAVLILCVAISASIYLMTRSGRR